MRRAAILVIGWVALAAIIAVVVGQLNIPTFVKLAKRGAPASATIARTTCDSHMTASYVFTVGSVQYSGSDSFTNCRELHPGDHVQIYYDVADPTLDRAGTPRARLTNEIISVALASLIIPTFVVGVILLRTRRARR